MPSAAAPLAPGWGAPPATPLAPAELPQSPAPSASGGLEDAFDLAAFSGGPAAGAPAPPAAAAAEDDPFADFGDAPAPAPLPGQQATGASLSLDFDDDLVV